MPFPNPPAALNNRLLPTRPLLLIVYVSRISIYDRNSLRPLLLPFHFLTCSECSSRSPRKRLEWMWTSDSGRTWLQCLYSTRCSFQCGTRWRLRWQRLAAPASDTSDSQSSLPSLGLRSTSNFSRNLRALDWIVPLSWPSQVISFRRTFGLELLTSSKYALSIYQTDWGRNGRAPRQ